MALENLAIRLIVGLIAGWIAGQLMRGRGFGLLGNIVVGVVGAMIGGYIFQFLNITIQDILGEIIAATIGAGLLVFLINMVRR